MVLMECLGGLRRGKVKDHTGSGGFFFEILAKTGSIKSWKNRRERMYGGVGQRKGLVCYFNTFLIGCLLQPIPELRKGKIKYGSRLGRLF
jgi:hypothetical protein